MSDFGDPAVLLPLAAVIFFWLVAMRSIAAGASWLAAVALCAGGTALLKIYFGACPLGYDLNNPSGHSSLSTLVFGALAVMILAELQASWQRIAVVAAATIFCLGIAISRVLLRLHTGPEIALGIVIGLAALAIFSAGYFRHRPVRRSLAPLLLAVVTIALLLHGRELQAEGLLQAIGRYFDVGALCV